MNQTANIYHDKPIRLLHYIKHLQTGGGESLIYNLYQHIDREKIQFDFAVNTNEEERLDAYIKGMGGNIYPICENESKLTALKLWETSKGFEKLLKSIHYDIVHIHCSNGQGLYYSNIARQCGINNIICHVHNTSVVGNFEEIKTIVHKEFRRKYMEAPSEYMACSMEAAKWLYDDNVINGKHFHILKNGIDVEKFKYSDKNRKSVREELGFQNKKVLCTIGRCVKEKNQIFTLMILEALLKIDSDYRLILIGEGELEEELKGFACSHGMKDKVAFIKSTDFVEKYLSASDYFILSSSSEGFGIVAIEAQANGLPTIISDNVPDDVVISPYCYRLKLSEGVSTWAEKIEEIKENCQRDFAGEYIKYAGYEIQSVADGLQDFYLELVNRR